MLLTALQPRYAGRRALCMRDGRLFFHKIWTAVDRENCQMGAYRVQINFRTKKEVWVIIIIIASVNPNACSFPFRCHHHRMPDPNTFPQEIWLSIAQYIPPLKLQELISLNSTFFEIGMDCRYRQMSFAYLDDRMVRNLSRLRSVIFIVLSSID